MQSDYVDNWDALPDTVQQALEPIIAQFDAAADLLFDRRLNLSFEAAVKELSIPGVVALTDGLRQLRDLLMARVTVAGGAEGELLFDAAIPLTAYDLPLYTPCVYLSQLAQYQDGQNVRVWKESTAEEIVQSCWSWRAASAPTLKWRASPSPPCTTWRTCTRTASRFWKWNRQTPTPGTSHRWLWGCSASDNG